ncbi:MAG TPA: oxidoreductase, partial [Sutterellaceae bacterium]|nr:oxidoreductase [Sutterellaceae bacterium]
MHKTTKRGFLKAALASGLALEAFPARSASPRSSEQLITIIDLDKCDGCTDLSIPACVRACRAKNQARYPEPQKPVQPYWPQPKYEDFSNDRDNISRLTPYNWIYLQHVSVDGKDIY